MGAPTYTTPSNDEIHNRFTYHSPSSEQADRYAMIRAMARELAQVMAENCPDSKEKDQALVNLEQSVMWANASIARNE